MRPGLSTPLGSKPSFTRLLKPASPAPSGSNTSTDARTEAGARTNVAWPPRRSSRPRIEAAPAHCQTASPARSARRPSRKTSAPLATWRRRIHGPCWARRNPPQRPLACAVRGEWLDFAHVAPERTRDLLVEHHRSPNGFISAISISLRCATEGAKPSSRRTVAAFGFRQNIEPGRHVIGQVRRARDVAGRAHGDRHRAHALRVVETGDEHAGFRLRLRAAP